MILKKKPKMIINHLRFFVVWIDNGGLLVSFCCELSRVSIADFFAFRSTSCLILCKVLVVSDSILQFWYLYKKIHKIDPLLSQIS